MIAQTTEYKKLSVSAVCSSLLRLFWQLLLNMGVGGWVVGGCSGQYGLLWCVRQISFYFQNVLPPFEYIASGMNNEHVLCTISFCPLFIYKHEANT